MGALLGSKNKATNKFSAAPPFLSPDQISLYLRDKARRNAQSSVNDAAQTHHMKVSTSISRIILGLIYLVFGLDYFFRFIPYEPNHTGVVAAFKDGLKGVGYFYPMMKSIQIVAGISFLTNRYAPFFA